MRLWIFGQAGPLLAICVTAALVTSVVAGEWRAGARAPEIIVLGSGNSLSLLVRSGDSRLLIAAGMNIDDFDRAYGAILRPTISRVDVLVVSGMGPQLQVPEQLVSRQTARAVFSMRPMGEGQTTGALASANATVVRRATTIRLSGSVTVRLTPAVDSTDSESWQVLIEHRNSRVLMVSNGLVAEQAKVPGAVVVVAGDITNQQVQRLGAAGLVVRGNEARGLLDVTTAYVPASTATPVWMVYDSEFLRLELDEGKILVRHVDPRLLIPSVPAASSMTATS